MRALLPSTVSASWTDDSPVKFFPIRRDEYPQQNSPSDLLPAERILSVDDYHPFLHVATLVETIFAEAGYRIESNFTGSPEFRSLYMSGAYPSRDTAALAARMGFYARRLAPATAQGNHLGRVSANPSTTANSVGNIVETATPQTLDTDGEPIPELCNNGNCFGFDKGRIVFTPTTEVSVGFEYYLKYTTDHRILTRERLRGFDSVYLGTGADMPFTLANRYEDRRTDISPGHRYLAIVFDHADGAQYRLAYTKDGVAEALWTGVFGAHGAGHDPGLGHRRRPRVAHPQRHPLGTLCGRLARCTTDTSPNRDGRPSSCGYEPPRNASPPHHPNSSTGFISTAQRRECRSRSTRSVHSDRGSRRHRVTAPQSLSPTSPGTQSGSRHCSKRCNTSST